MLIKLLKNPLVLIPLLAGILLPCAIFLFVHFSQRAIANSQLVLKDAVVISGQPLPEIELVDLDGASVAPEELRNGKVMLVFLTTNCPACQKELKLISRMQPRISEKVKIYGVGIQTAGEIAQFMQAHEIRTPILLDRETALMRSLHVKYFPTKFLIKNGEIVNTWFGNSLDEAELLRQLEL